MSTTAAIVSEVRLILSGEPLPQNVDPAQRAQEFAQLCRLANERLRLCRDHLRKNMRSEALHTAETEPILLDLCAALDFSGSERWRKLCGERGWAVPEPLDGAAISALNDAYAAGLKIEPLLQEHRRAVRAGDTKASVAALRQLAKADAQNRSWIEDLRGFEGKRLRELRALLAKTRERDDLPALESLLEELRGVWSVQGADALATELEGAIAACRRKEALRRGIEVVAAIGQAYSALDYRKTRAGLDEYQRLRQAGHLVPTREMQAQVEDATEWCREEKKRLDDDLKFDETLVRLRAVLAKDVPGPELRRLWIVLESLGRPLPEEIDNRARTALENCELAERRRRILRVLVSGSLAALLLAAAIGAFIHWRTGRLTKQFAAQLQACHARDDLTQFDLALDAVRGHHPRVYRSAEVQDWAVKRSELVAREETRQGAVAELLGELEQIHEGGFAEVSHKTDALLQEVEGKVRSPGEKTRLLQVRIAWNAHQAAALAKREHALNAALDEAAGMFAAAGDFGTRSCADLRARLDPLRERVREAEAKAIDVPPERVAQVRGLRARLVELERALGERELLFADLLNASDIGSFGRAQERYRNVFAEDYLVSRMSTQQNVASAEALLALGQGLNDDAEPTVEQLRALAAAARDTNPFWAVAIGRLHNRAEATAANWGRVQQAVLGIGRNPYFGELSTFRLVGTTPADKRVYEGFIKGQFTTVKGRQGESDAVEGEVYFPLASDTAEDFRRLKFYTNTRRVEQVVPLPHCAVVRDLAARLPGTGTAAGRFGPDLFLVQAVADLAKRDAILPLVRLTLGRFLLEQMLLVAGEGPGVERIRTLQKRLDAGKVESSWLCTRREDVKRASEQAQALLADAFKDDAWLNHHRAECLLLRSALARQLRWVGVASMEDKPRVCWRPGMGVKLPPEIWVLRAVDRQTVPWVIDAKSLGPEWACGELLPGEPIFAPGDGRETTRLRDELTGGAAAALSPESWPRGWPVNCRAGAR